MDHDLGGAQLVYIGAIRRDRSSIIADTDIGPAPVAIFGVDYYTKTMTHEVRLASDNSGGSSWIAGLYYLKSKGGPRLNVFVGPTRFLAARIVGDVETDSYSVFGEYALRLFRNGRLTLGGRYTIDKRDATGSVNGNRLPDAKDKWKEPTWRIVYDHHLTRDAMVFASYNRGFKSGNFNLIPLSPSFDPEILDAFEAGAKTTFLGGRLRLNASAFYYKYKDLQVRITQSFSTTTFNAASAKVKGVEGDFSFTPIEGVTLSGAAAYVDSEYTSFRNAQSFVPVFDLVAPGQRCPGVTTGPIPSGGNCVVPVDATGKPLIRSPKFSGNLGLTWVQPLSGGKLTSTVRVAYRDGFNWEPDGRVPEDSNTLVNGSIAWHSADDAWGFGVRGENIFGSKYQIYGGSVETGDYFSAGTPATYTAFAEFKF